MAVDFAGKWYNQHRSMMDLTVDNSGKVTGTYQTGVGSPQPPEKFALVGFVSGDLLVFAVNFGKYGSLTSWSGQHTENKAGNVEIHTLWHLAKNIPDADEPTELWAGIWSGADIFRRTEPTTLVEGRVKPMPSHPLA